MRTIGMILTGALFCFYFSGCATVEKMLPFHDEVLVYELPLDLTYLRTTEAMETLPGWVIESTDKEKGVIAARNVEYSRLDDSDTRTVTVLVKRVDRTHTSVTLAPESQRSLSGGDMLKAIDTMLSAELK
ncbi:MAG: hypothetical protein BWY44_01129 [Candidatus Omnitrophica bacterium ADurb.Bin292]|jgi:hypothetical protein|nr:MAG: hypothetical protein BWY44_01129 [Candidatus Omnitrophica bacterium ADurb.Bin292]HOG24438.1 hypothetical protein [Candidatus Omnitrophota bacterium]HPW76675.1 hypothetical protein [Candidatus Omnitrophota bacterium]